MFSEEMVKSVGGGSEIRAMFEQGAKLAAQFGAENVYDFTLGNPDPEADPEVTAAIKKYADEPGIHKYMPNAGYKDVREKIAAYMKEQNGVDYTFENVLMIAGAAAGLNVVLKSLLNPGENVIVIAPYFVEYLSYIRNHRGVPNIVKAKADSFDIDVDAVVNAINSETKAILLNSPNNPTGVVYSEEALRALAEAVAKKEEEYGHEIYVLSDEPYIKLTYSGVKVPSIPSIFRNSIVVNSFSKSLALPGERIGYIIVNPAIKDADILMQGMIICARTLGYVNAPSLVQKVIADNLDLTTGLESYAERGELLYNIITEAGFECLKPQGAFYLFPKAPIEDDRAFCKAALKYNLILVSGSGFGCPGYFRLAYCVSKETILRSKNAWMELGKEFGLI